MTSANHSAAPTIVVTTTRFVGTGTGTDTGHEWRVECGPRPRSAYAASIMKPGRAVRRDSGISDTGIFDAAYRLQG